MARFFNYVTFCYKDDVLSLHTAKLGDFVDKIYPIELEIKVTSETTGLLHTLTYTSKLTVRVGHERNFTTKDMI